MREAKAIVQQVVMNYRPEAGRGKKTIQQLLVDAQLVEASGGEAGEEGGGGAGSVGGLGGLGADRSFVNEVMGLLKNLCEGHFLPMQNLLRQQVRV